MFTRSLSIIALIFFLSACSGGSSPVDKTIHEGKPLVKVGNEEIREGYLNLLQRVNPGIKAQLEAPMGKKRLIDNLVEQELFFQEAVSRGLDKSPQVQEKADLYKRVIIAQSLIDEEVDKKTKEYYNQNKEKEFERVKIAHIFFSGNPIPSPAAPGKMPSPPTEEDKKKATQEAERKAKEAYQRLKNGEAWDSVVKESDDKGSVPRNGEIGYFTRNDRRAERLDYKGILDAAFSLAKGAYSEPIQAKDGWHIIEVVEDKKISPYEDVAMSIKFKIRGETKNALVAELKKKKNVQYIDTSLAESMPTLRMPATETEPPKIKMEESKPAESKPAETKPH